MSRPNLIVGATLAAAFAIALAIVLVPGHAPDAGLRAIVHDGDGGTHELPLSQDAELAVTTSLGANVVVVQDGAVFVREADCENHDCVRQGRISAAGQQLVCLPHRLWVEIVPDGGAPGQMDVDAVPDAGEDLDAIAR